MITKGKHIKFITKLLLTSSLLIPTLAMADSIPQCSTDALNPQQVHVGKTYQCYMGHDSSTGFSVGFVSINPAPNTISNLQYHTMQCTFTNEEPSKDPHLSVQETVEDNIETLEFTKKFLTFTSRRICLTHLNQ